MLYTLWKEEPLSDWSSLKVRSFISCFIVNSAYSKGFNWHSFARKTKGGWKFLLVVDDDSMAKEVLFSLCRQQKIISPKLSLLPRPFLSMGTRDTVSPNVQKWLLLSRSGITPILQHPEGFHTKVVKVYTFVPDTHKSWPLFASLPAWRESENDDILLQEGFPWGSIDDGEQVV